MNEYFIEDITKLERSSYLWISPDGRVYGNGSHYRVAASICGDNGIMVADCGDILLKRGWIKLSDSCMASIYEKDGMYNNLTDEQLAVCKELDALYPGKWFFSTSFLYEEKA